MKEIKFRAWDKKYNLMIQPDSTMAYDTFIAFDGTVHELGEWSGYSGGGKTDEDVTKNYILMQYTGLNDKNGKEIWEGDILKIYGETNDGRLCVVIYDSEKACFRGAGNFLFQYLEPFNLVEFEVVGNIYANPELLEVTP